MVNGVTTVRQMSSSNAVRGWRADISSGTRLGPQFRIGSAILDGAPSLWEGLGPPYVAVADADQARAAVRQESGADFLKTYTRLSRESFHAIAAEARRIDLPFLGHVPDFVPVTEASDAGLHSIEHLFEFWYDTSRDERRICAGRFPHQGGRWRLRRMVHRPAPGRVRGSPQLQPGPSRQGRSSGWPATTLT